MVDPILERDEETGQTVYVCQTGHKHENMTGAIRCNLMDETISGGISCNACGSLTAVNYSPMCKVNLCAVCRSNGAYATNYLISTIRGLADCAKALINTEDKGKVSAYCLENLRSHVAEACDLVSRSRQPTSGTYRTRSKGPTAS